MFCFGFFFFFFKKVNEKKNISWNFPWQTRSPQVYSLPVCTTHYFSITVGPFEAVSWRDGTLLEKKKRLCLKYFFHFVAWRPKKLYHDPSIPPSSIQVRFGSTGRTPARSSGWDSRLPSATAGAQVWVVTSLQCQQYMTARGRTAASAAPH